MAIAEGAAEVWMLNGILGEHGFAEGFFEV
jgi:hypothetical protein